MPVNIDLIINITFVSSYINVMMTIKNNKKRTTQLRTFYPLRKQNSILYRQVGKVAPVYGLKIRCINIFDDFFFKLQ